MRTDPELYQRDCRHCWQYMYHEEGPNKGETHQFRGEPLERSGGPPPCMFPVGCQKGTIDRQRVLSETNARSVMHYRECRAVGDFPKDDIVRRNAAIIRETEDMIERSERAQIAAFIRALAMRGVV